MLKAPEGWKKLYSVIEIYRKANKADIDTMNCCALPEVGLPGAARRYQLLTSLQLSSQTKDPTTAQAISNLQAIGLSPQNVIDLPSEILNQAICKVGFHNRKTIYMKETAAILVEQYNSDIPDTLEGLLALPGVGPKMAYLTMQEAWGKSIGIGVDTHVHRISNRLGWVSQTKTPEHTRKELEGWLPQPYWEPVNSLLVGFGQTICRPIGPRCYECPAREICPKIGVVMSSQKKKLLSEALLLAGIVLDYEDDDKEKFELELDDEAFETKKLKPKKQFKVEKVPKGKAEKVKVEKKVKVKEEKVQSETVRTSARLWSMEKKDYRLIKPEGDI